MAEPAAVLGAHEAAPDDVDTEGDDAVGESTPLGDVTVLARDLHVYYRVYEDRRPRIGEVFARRFRRPGFREIRAVRGVDLEARQGESIGLIGRNGSGKSTLLQAIAGVLPPSRGEVYARSQPSLLGVSAALQKNVSGRRNIVLGGLALGLSREEIEARVDDIVEWTGLEDFIDLPIRTYSSGMKARLHFAIATSVEPEILLVDEALSVGDEVFKERSKERIQGLLAGAGTVFVCSHSMSTIRDMCTRVLWLEDGRIVRDGDPEDVVREYKRAYKPKKTKEERKRERRRAAREAAAAEGSADDPGRLAEAAAAAGTAGAGGADPAAEGEADPAAADPAGPAATDPATEGEPAPPAGAAGNGDPAGDDADTAHAAPGAEGDDTASEPPQRRPGAETDDDPTRPREQTRATSKEHPR